ncbi:hypothetical protein [Streptomyces sp. NPDC048639]|uniref:hypothetical protein n=1 Tax=Streptomyces sp. NPDC048639 TaxID=3365581 RepID=UPI003721A210
MAVGCACAGYLLLLIAALSGVLEQQSQSQPHPRYEPSGVSATTPTATPARSDATRGDSSPSAPHGEGSPAVVPSPGHDRTAPVPAYVLSAPGGGNAT